MRVKRFFFLLLVVITLFFAFEQCKPLKKATVERDFASVSAQRGDTRNGYYIPNNLSFGEPTVGGLNGKVIKVTNLNNRGPGSLREAIETRGTRLIVFEVGGVIDLEKSSLVIRESEVTIAGQTAPSPGITLIKGGIQIRASDVIVQHLRVRPGDAGEKSGSRFEPDGIATYGPQASNIIVDHCSISWAVDEGLSASGPRTGIDSTSRRITFSNNLVAEGLMKASHAKGSHSMGSLIHDFVQDVAVVGNFYYCNYDRNPLFKASTKGVILNNLIYNPGQFAIRLTWIEEEFRNSRLIPENSAVSIVGNVLRKGVDSRNEMALIMGKGIAYVEDNISYNIHGKQDVIIYPQTPVLRQQPSWIHSFIPLPSSMVEQYVLNNVGARPWDRDAIDKRIFNTYINRSGRIINSQDDVGGYPKFKPTYRMLEVPDSRREIWLDSFVM